MVFFWGVVGWFLLGHALTLKSSKWLSCPTWCYNCLGRSTWATRLPHHGRHIILRGVQPARWWTHGPVGQIYRIGLFIIMGLLMMASNNLVKSKCVNFGFQLYKSLIIKDTQPSVEMRLVLRTQVGSRCIKMWELVIFIYVWYIKSISWNKRRLENRQPPMENSTLKAIYASAQNPKVAILQQSAPTQLIQL